MATHSSMELAHYANSGLSKIFVSEYDYRKAGVVLMDLHSQNAIQGDLWDKVDREKHK